MAKKAENGDARTCVTLSTILANAKLTRRRERRLLALIAAGATIAEAGRAVRALDIYRSARANPRFAERLAAARENRALTPVEALDWREAARWLEVESPERWALPEMPDDFAT